MARAARARRGRIAGRGNVGEAAGTGGGRGGRAGGGGGGGGVLTMRGRGGGAGAGAPAHLRRKGARRRPVPPPAPPVLAPRRRQRDVRQYFLQIFWAAQNLPPSGAPAMSRPPSLIPSAREGGFSHTQKPVAIAYQPGPALVRAAARDVIYLSIYLSTSPGLRGHLPAPVCGRGLHACTSRDLADPEGTVAITLALVVPNLTCMSSSIR